MAWRVAGWMAACSGVALGACHKRGTPSAPDASAALELQIAARAPGETSLEVERSTTRALEQAGVDVARAAHTRSVTHEGQAAVVVAVSSRDGQDAMASQLQRALGQTLRPGRSVTVQRVGGRAVERYILRSEVLPLPEVGQYAQQELVTRLARVPGVDHVSTCGVRDASVLVELDPVSMAGAGLTLDDVTAALMAVKPLVADGDASALRPLVIGYKNGARIRVNDIASVVDNAEPSPCTALDARSVVGEVIVHAATTADPARLSDALQQALAASRAALPAGIDVAAFHASRTLTVDLDPAMTLVVKYQLAKTVGAAVGGRGVLMELGDASDEEPGLSRSMRVLLADSDPAVATVAQATLRNSSLVGSMGEANATVQLLGADVEALTAAGEQLVRVLVAQGALVSRLGFPDGPPALQAVTDPATMVRLGVSQASVDAVLAARSGLRLVGDQDERPSPVLLRFKEGALEHLYVRAGETAVPLSAFTVLQSVRAPSTILRVDGRRMIGARVHVSDVAALKTLYAPPAGIELRVVGD